MKWKVNDRSVGTGSSKCLVLGGYAILDNENIGLVCSLEPKVECELKVTNESGELKFNVKCLLVNKSFVITEKDFINLSQDNLSEKFEKFILTSLNTFFRYFNSKIKVECNMTINPDNKFYNRNGKNGLGSSSATTVAIMDALLNMSFDEENRSKELLFQLSCIAHSLAQGKIGSCFDISSAVYGSHVFRRPSDKFLKFECIGQQWDNSHTYFTLPKGTRLVLIATNLKGSSTPSLVRRFDEIKINNAELYKRFVNSISNAISCITNTKTLDEQAIQDIRSSFNNVKDVQMYITNNYNIEILPSEVLDLIKKLEANNDVIVGFVPGAGGYDAIALITKDCDIVTDQEIIATKVF